MAIYKRCTRCYTRLPSGTRCSCQKGRQKEYDKYTRDRQSTQFYNSKEWEFARQATLALDKGIDVYIYITTGKVILADTVHHIEPLKDNWDRRCDIDNLISLASDTHSTVEQMYLKDKKGMMNKMYKVLKEYRNGKG